MIPTGHLLVGGAIGVSLSSLPTEIATPIALAAGVASHHVLDWIPHTDAGTFYPDHCDKIPKRVLLVIVLEGLLGLALTAFFFWTHYPTLPFLAGAIGGMIPDILDNIPLWKKQFRETRLGQKWHEFHEKWHCGEMAQIWLLGIVVDLLVVSGGIWYLMA